MDNLEVKESLDKAFVAHFVVFGGGDGMEWKRRAIAVLLAVSMIVSACPSSA